MHQLSFRTLALFALAGALVAGCSAPVKPEPPKLDPDMAVDQANTLIASGQKAQAVEVLDRAARDNPVSAKPWLRKAQLQFDEADYPASIVSAEEAVKRDSTSQEAKSVAIVASLRIAIKSLTELRGEQNLNTSAQAEAQRLAGLLRESVSADLLVPPAETAETAKKPAARKLVARKGPTAAARLDTPPPPTPPPAEKPSDSSDPFGALRN